jgi:hypothetical protein
MRIPITFAAVLCSAATARADATAPPAVAAPDLGTPLPMQGAMPAFTGVGIGYGLDATDVPSVPRIGLGHGLATPGGNAMFSGVDIEEYVGGHHGQLGSFSFVTVRFNWELQVTGSASNAFAVDGAAYDGGDVHFFRFGLPAPGIGYRTRNWLASVQLAPDLELYTTGYRGPMSGVSGHSLVFALAADAQVCKQYNFLGLSSRNAPACVYIAPVVFRDGGLGGASFGVRVFLF